MTALRQKAVNMLKELPEENLPEIIVVMTKYNDKLPEYEKRDEEKILSLEEKEKMLKVLEERFLKNNKKYHEFMKLCKKVPEDRNNDMELAQSREERFGYENIA